MGALQKLFKHTFIYGIATVLPRILTVLLTRLYTDKLPTDEYGVVNLVFAYMVFSNVILSYGMETAFFRFMNKNEKKSEVQATALTTLLITSILFLCIVFPFREAIASFMNVQTIYVTYAIGILVLDALVVIPFAWLRNNEKPLKYSFLKIFNVVVNLSLNLFFFLVLPTLIQNNTHHFLNWAYLGDTSITYIFVANFAASLVTLILLLPLYRKIGVSLNIPILKKMLQYGLPILIAGIAFAINEHFDKILLERLLPPETAKSELGIYSACYKLGVFMTLFVTAFKLGVEPFFFSNASNKDAKETYANITLYFTIFASVILLGVIVYIDLFKQILIADEAYWGAIIIVPIILLANLCLGLYHNLSVWYKITDRTRYGAYISVFGALVTLALNFLLIPVIGYVGSALATLAAYGTMMTTSYLFGQKNYPIPYNLKKIGSYLVLAIGFSALSFYGFERELIKGTGLLLLFLGFVYFNEKKEIQKLFFKK
ncbi:lipopolysaccharide biosynthesis protein [Ascidiimonas sp. W6]|uniref:lipopolysaccharide biosynthesis protein n=1 Tax=Ascidiimonas meishanensis TaxID=3128903 RepID=UPI0030EF01C4